LESGLKVIQASFYTQNDMFISKNLIRIHDIDMLGILYFPRQFRFVHEALEDFLESEGLRFDTLLYDEDFIFVIVHCEADYLAPLRLGDRLEVQVFVDHIGNTSFTMSYFIYRKEGKKVGTAKTVHVCLDAKTRTPIPIDQKLKKILERHSKR